jgi:hypothetical protein
LSSNCLATEILDASYCYFREGKNPFYFYLFFKDETAPGLFHIRDRLVFDLFLNHHHLLSDFFKRNKSQELVRKKKKKKYFAHRAGALNSKMGKINNIFLTKCSQKENSRSQLILHSRRPWKPTKWAVTNKKKKLQDISFAIEKIWWEMSKMILTFKKVNFQKNRPSLTSFSSWRKTMG